MCREPTNVCHTWCLPPLKECSAKGRQCSSLCPPPAQVSPEWGIPCRGMKGESLACDWPLWCTPSNQWIGWEWVWLGFCSKGSLICLCGAHWRRSKEERWPSFCPRSLCLPPGISGEPETHKNWAGFPTVEESHCSQWTYFRVSLNRMQTQLPEKCGEDHSPSSQA